jgi:predicted acylesterase/phospholipase RssA
MNSALIDRMRSPGPKKILACDGGGIRGLISVEILARLEAELRSARNDPTLVLADVFDFACGTSTGAIIAACVSAGMSMDAVRQFYVGSGKQMFDKASIFKRLQYSYNDEPLAATLRQALDQAVQHVPTAAAPNAVLGSPGLRTLLMMVLRNHTTDSPWPVSNNPGGRYNQRVRDDGTARLDCNLDLPLWQLVRASTAAPTFFPPEVVIFAEGTEREYQFVFVDGGVTTYNNPAYLAFQMATAAPYGINWATGSDKLFVVSVGTGKAANDRPDLQADDLWLLDHAKNIPSALMNAAVDGWDMACRTIGECRFGSEIDREFGDLAVEAGSTSGRLFSYVRYDPDVTPEGLSRLGLADVDSAHVRLMDSTDHIAEIQKVGTTYSARHVDIERHFAGFLG